MSAANYVTAVRDGDFHDPATWGMRVVPSHFATFDSGEHRVTISRDVKAYQLTGTGRGGFAVVRPRPYWWEWLLYVITLGGYRTHDTIRIEADICRPVNAVNCITLSCADHVALHVAGNVVYGFPAAATQLYLIRMWGCVEPELYGPYASDAERLAAAKQLRGDEHALLRLDVGHDGPNVDCFTGCELEENQQHERRL